MAISNHRRISNYYASLQHFYDTIFDQSGFYNLGLLPKGSECSLTDAQRKLVRFVIEPLKQFRGGKVLDIGCGQGAPARLTATEIGVEVVGLDLLSSQLEFWRKAPNPDVSFVKGDATTLPFADGSFNGIYSIESAFHYHDKASFIRECARVLKPGGKMALADIMKVKRVGGSLILPGLARAAGASSFFSTEEYSDTATQVGLKTVRSEDISRAVARSLRGLSNSIFEHRDLLLRDFSIGFLVGGIIASWSYPLFQRLLPAEYRLMVFEK